MITVDKLGYTYPETARPVLREIDLNVPSGQFLGVVGPSGAGKTTLAQALAGYIPHVLGGEVTGRVEIGGLHVVDTPLPDLVTRVGMVSQNPFNQISGAKFTVAEELAFGLENLGVPRQDMLIAVREVLRRLRIEHLAERSPYELSGGQQQLVALGAMLVMNPDVLVLDEPTSQLDPAGSRLVFEALGELRSRDITVVLIEHKIERLAEFADRVVVLVDGELRMDGPPGTVLAAPELVEWGIGHTRFTTAAVRAGGRWPSGAALPVTLDQALAGFGGAR
ncbi:ATP-binding cassette domain-containing protein [Kutzneria viridogrisea]|uniref:ABC transporter ATP-binding protein n=2 Tax=Kutzneria TaxID=43356 RepID=W5W3F7_9PSEU|nr:ABC transporter ATP-binding protein [Kutzneria albida]AHH95377.1 ABC transporter ATP-binding protein [Kutzneria albida DSM 43870]MBA8927266.1 energy-coupling factor transporter ATP-binding protein EcfA2 [Kutzneria viridogrisea]